MGRSKFNIRFMTFFFTVGFLLVIAHSITAQDKTKIYKFNFGQMKSLTNFVVPQKYKAMWNDIIRAKKKGKNEQQILKMTKRKYKIGLEEYDSVIKDMGFQGKFVNYIKDIMLNRNSVMKLIFKGAVTPPKGTPQYDDAVEAVLPTMHEAIKPYMDKIRVQPVLYPGGVLGDEPDYIRKIKLGEVQWAGGTIVMGEMVAPEVSVFDLPFIFDYEPKEYYDDLSFCQIDWILDKASPQINEFLMKRGFLLVGLLDGGGYECIATSKIPVSKADDLKKLTFFMFPQARIAADINKAYGFKKTLVCKIWDIPSIAATGMLDSVVCCWYWHIIIQGTPYYKYVTDFPIRGFMAAIALAQKAFFDDIVKLCTGLGPMFGIDGREGTKMVKNLLTVINKSIKSVMRRNLRIKEAEARREILKKGIYKMVKFPEEEIEKLKAKILPLYTKLADKKGTYPRWFLDDILKYRAEYRKYKKEGKLTSKWYKKGIFPDGYEPTAWIQKLKVGDSR